MVREYAIETIDVVKRYPSVSGDSNQGRGRGGGPGGGARGIDSFSGLRGLFSRKKRSYMEALRGINLQIPKGEVFGLLGPNGAGKTTLIKILCTLVIHDEGEVFVNGINLKKDPSRVVRNLQAVLPESRGFNWRLSGRQNLAFYALLYGIGEKEARERISYLLGLTGLADRADDSYQRYSTGMQRRLLLCRALLRDTSILLFDEPTAGLDPLAAADFRSLVRDKLAREEGTTILMSTHNLYEAQEICDRIAILEKGRITACDTPANIKRTVIGEKILDITCSEGYFDTGQEQEMLSALRLRPGVREITFDIGRERNLRAISVRVDKEMNLSGILELIVSRTPGILSITTSEPSLEEVFMRITRREQRR